MTTPPTRVLPVKKMWSHFCSSRAVVSGTAPSTMAMASSSTYCGTRRAMAAEQAGESSLGLPTTALPAAIAAAMGLISSWMG